MKLLLSQLFAVGALAVSVLFAPTAWLFGAAGVFLHV